MKPEPAQMLQLRDIHAPLAPSLWPPAPGWWLLALLSLAVLIVIGIWGVRRWRHARLRRRVLAELQQLDALPQADQRLARLSTLLKQVALARYPRREVAALSGPAWLDFLDRTGGNGRFRDGPGQVLASGPYAPPDSDQGTVQMNELIGLGKAWVRKNL